MDATIYFEYYLSPRLGGPPGYLDNLKTALDMVPAGGPSVSFATLGRNIEARPQASRPVVTPWWRPIKKYKIEKRRRRGVTASAYDHAKWLQSLPFDGPYGSDLLSSIPLPEVDFVHAHTTIEAAKLIRATRDLKKRPIVALTSHCPEAPSREWSEKFRSEGADEKVVKLYQNAYEKVDLFAFEKSDCLIFPCEEAMEPYFKTMPGFEKVVSNKPIFYLPTGAPPLSVIRGKDEVRTRFGIPRDAFLIGYIGRHNGIKGYDLLSRVALNLIADNPNVWVLCAGPEGPLPTPKHDRWIEAGWTDCPGDLINAFDVFVLPNRETYFDLIAIEVMSVGTPLIASDRGGNKYIGKLSDGITLFEDQQGLLQAITQLMSGGHGLRDFLSAQNTTAYERNFSLLKFAENYKAVISDAYGKLRQEHE